MRALRNRFFGPLWYLRRLTQIFGIVIGIPAASIGGYCGYLRYTGNIHVVKAGELYRSAQLNDEEFAETISKYHIRSILNLRGEDPGETWYDAELKVSHRMGARHIDYGIWASSAATDRQIEDILRIVRDAPKPLLIHCNGGADRSGLVAALYLAEIDGVPADTAAGQLSLFYGHFPYLTSRTGAMDASFWRYVKENPEPSKFSFKNEQVVQSQGRAAPY